MIDYTPGKQFCIEMLEKCLINLRRHFLKKKKKRGDIITYCMLYTQAIHIYLFIWIEKKMWINKIKLSEYVKFAMTTYEH